MLSDSPQWVAIYTRARAEKQVVERLAAIGLETYLPIVQKKHFWSDRVKLVNEPLFRSYVFAKICANQQVQVRETTGVAYLVMFRNEVQTVPDAQIEAVQRFLGEKQEVFVRESNALHKGVRVRITDGAFAGLEGLLISNCKEGNFEIRIEAIGLSLVTSIDRLRLEALELN